MRRWSACLLFPDALIPVKLWPGVRGDDGKSEEILKWRMSTRCAAFCLHL